MADYLVFADESGTSAESPCYSIGALVVPSELHEPFVRKFDQLRTRHGVTHEVKWNRIGSSYGVINFVLDWLMLINRTRLTFGIIVVRKAAYHNWSCGGADREEAFYKTYTMLMSDLGRRHAGTFEVYIDQRPDRYAKRDEVMQKIANYRLAAIGRPSKVTRVRKSDSRLIPGIQLADVLTGAINASHREWLDSSFRLRRGKRVLIDSLASALGWDALYYDTMPNPRFNIWHFPMEQYRAQPATRRIRFVPNVPYLGPEDLRGSSS